MAACRWPWLYYARFILAAVFEAISLFTAIMIGNLEAARMDPLSPASQFEDTDRARQRLLAA